MNLRPDFRNLLLLGLDVDGVLTDGGVYVFEDGAEFRRFDIKDGLGIKQLIQAGIEIVIISSSRISAVRHRAADLGISAVYLGIPDKLATMQAHCDERGLSLAQTGFVGDDLADLPLLQAVGYPCAVADAIAEVRALSIFVTQRPGGRGAVRELAEAILASRATHTEDEAL